MWQNGIHRIREQGARQLKYKTMHPRKLKYDIICKPSRGDVVSKTKKVIVTKVSPKLIVFLNIDKHIFWYVINRWSWKYDYNAHVGRLYK